MNESIMLVKEIRQNDEIGNDLSVSKEPRRVFCEIQSISQKEFMSAGQAGYKPDFRVKMWAHEYDGESEIHFCGNVYTVYRTYVDKEFIELYLTKKTGAIQHG